MKRLAFLFAVILGACVIGITGRAQFSSNPAVEATTNNTQLTPIGNGFGVALLGYGLPESNVNTGTSSNYLFFATPMGQPSASDGMYVNGKYQFYVVGTDRDGNAPYVHSDLFAFKVVQPLSDPSKLTVIRTWPARVVTNAITGAVQAGSLAACGITDNGTIAVRVDASSSVTGNGNAQGMYLFSADSLNTVVITNVQTSSCLVTGDTATLKFGQLGKINALLSGNSFGNTQYVARADISATDPNLKPHAQLLSADHDRSSLAINDTAKLLAYWRKSPDEVDLGDGIDVCTRLTVYYYNDTGGAITLDTTKGSGTGSNVWAFGNRTGNNQFTDTINTNAIDIYSATAFNGPPQISVNDNGEMAFPVAINCWLGPLNSNGTRTATITGIVWKDANTGTFRKVAASDDSTVFLQIPPVVGNGTPNTNNLFSPPSLDNRGNMFFEATFTNTIVGGTNYYSDFDLSNAVYQAVPNHYPNPTSWTSRILIREGDTFTEPNSGDTIEVAGLPLGSFASQRSNVPRSLGANSINRSPLPGTTNDLGGVVVCATLSNITKNTRFDGLLYIAPYYTTAIPQFYITSIARSGNDVTLNWVGWKGSNVIQTAVGGNYANSTFTPSFADLATNWLATDGASSYLHSGAYSPPNTTNRYYRIKWLPNSYPPGS
ncbi:MAG TPA: hypothetical protein VL486_05780 [Verrucomicrobiae bacterium]|nr:hypothetical protein [Verrucomicrobiae bacterium]